MGPHEEQKSAGRLKLRAVAIGPQKGFVGPMPRVYELKLLPVAAHRDKT